MPQASRTGVILLQAVPSIAMVALEQMNQAILKMYFKTFKRKLDISVTVAQLR